MHLLGEAEPDAGPVARPSRRPTASRRRSSSVLRVEQVEEKLDGARARALDERGLLD